MVGIVAMLGWAMIQGPRYEVNAKILVKLGREMMPSPAVGARDGTQVMPVTLRPEDAASEIEILTDPNLVRQVVESFDPAFFLAEPPATTFLQQAKRLPRAALRAVSDGMRDSLVALGLRPVTTPLDRVTLGLTAALEVAPVRKSDVIGLKLVVADPQAGVVLLDRFISLAMASHVKAHHVSRERTVFVQERAMRSHELDVAQARFLTIRNENYGAWLAPEQRSLLLKAVADLQLQNAQALADAAQTAAEITSIEGALAQLPREVQTSSVRTRNRIGDDLQGKLIQLELDLAGLRTRYAPGSPDIADTQHQIDVINERLAAHPAFQVAEVTTGLSQRHEEFARQLMAKQNQLAGQRARAGQIAAQLDELQLQLRSVQSAEIEVDRLQREITRLHRLIDLYDGGIDDARISEAMQAANISDLRIIMAPTADLLPSAPSLKRFVILGFAGGLLLAVASILLQAFIGQRLAPGTPVDPARPRSTMTPQEVRS